MKITRERLRDIRATIITNNIGGESMRDELLEIVNAYVPIKPEEALAPSEESEARSPVEDQAPEPSPESPAPSRAAGRGHRRSR